MESIERYSGLFQGDEIRLTRRFADFAQGDAIPPNDIRLFSEAQFQQAQAAASSANGMDERPAPFDPSLMIEWSPAWSLRDARFKYLPTSLLYYAYKGPGRDQVGADSNGCAAGNTLEEAIVQGFLELVERDAVGIWWHNRLERPELDVARLDDPYIRDLDASFAERGQRLWLLDITSDLAVPAVFAIAHWIQGG